MSSTKFIFHICEWRQIKMVNVKNHRIWGQMQRCNLRHKCTDIFFMSVGKIRVIFSYFFYESERWNDARCVVGMATQKGVDAAVVQP